MVRSIAVGGSPTTKLRAWRSRAPSVPGQPGGGVQVVDISDIGILGSLAKTLPTPVWDVAVKDPSTPSPSAVSSTLDASKNLQQLKVIGLQA